MLMKETDLDSERFDGLSRALGRGATRRGALGVLAGFAGFGLSGVATRAKRKPKAAKVDVCHYNADENTWVKIRVSQRGWNRGHSKHAQDFLRGTVEDGGCCNDNDCSLDIDKPFCSPTNGTCVAPLDGGGLS
jgi:hypothetical protein